MNSMCMVVVLCGLWLLHWTPRVEGTLVEDVGTGNPKYAVATASHLRRTSGVATSHLLNPCGGAARCLRPRPFSDIRMIV